MRAAEKGDTPTVNVLLAKGADVHAYNQARDTALTLAAQQGHTSTVETLLAKGADISTRA
jgi:uncharacterized protein